MNSFSVYYIESNIVCVIVFIILLLHNHFNIDRQEKQVKFDHVLISYICYFLTDCFWAAIVDGLIPKTLFTVTTNTFLIYLFMVAITYFWLQYVLAVEQVAHRARPINRFAVLFPFLVATVALILHFILSPHTLINESFDTQPAFSVYLATVPCIYLIAILFYTIRRARKNENPAMKRRHLYIGLFPLITFVGGMIQMVFFPLHPIYCSVSMSLMLLFYIQSMSAQVSLDPLTSLNNRGQFMHYISQKNNLYIDDRLTFVLMMDINDFKHINDTFGHAEGDRALLTVSDSLKKVISRYSMPSFLGRYGGDEFVLIIHPVQADEPERLIGEIRDEIDRNVFLNGLPYHISVGIGCDELTDKDDSIQACLQRADKKLYLNKNNMKHRVRNAA